MSGIRGSLVFLLLMVSVISIFVLNRWKPEIRPGAPARSTEKGSRDSDQRAGNTEIDQGNANNPGSTVDDPSITERNGSQSTGSTQDNGSAGGVPESNGPFEVLLRVMDSRGNPVAAGLQTGLFQPSGEPIESTDSSQELQVQGLVVGGFGSLESGLSKSTSRLEIDPPPTGRWIVDSTLQEAPSDLLTIERLVLLRPDSVEFPSLLVIPAMTKAPVGSRLRIQVVGDGRTLDGGILKVTGEDNLWQLPLVPRQWYAGLLRVEVVWSWEAATGDRQNQVLDIRGEEFAGQDWSWSGTLSVDTADEAKRQGDKIRRWYRQLLDEVEMTRDLLLVAGAHARGKRAKLVRDDARYSRMLTHPLAPVLDDLGRGSRFDERRWRRLLDEDLPQRWSPWVEEGAIPWPDRYPGPARNVPLLFHTLVKYSRLESTVIYMALGKERHPNDFVADFDWDPATERTQTLGKLRNFINAIREKLSELEGD